MIARVEEKQGYVPEEFDEQQSQQIIRAFKEIWSLDDGQTKVIIPAFDINRYDISNAAKAEFEKIFEHGNIAYRSDLMAASMIEWLLILLSNYEDVGIIFDNNDLDLYSPEFSESNIIALCGPDGSYITKRLFEDILKIDSPFIKKADQTALNWRGEQYNPLLNEKGEMLSDYGMIYKRRNPLANNERYIYIFAGCRAYATQGAAAALTIAGIVYEVFCLNSEIHTDEFNLPVKVSGNKPLYLSRDELFVSIIHPETSSYKNYIDAVASINFLRYELKPNPGIFAKRLYTRYSNLIDKKFMEGLSSKEESEVEKLVMKLDSIEDQLYEPVEQLLTKKLKEITEKKNSKED